jgi:hypothetical protein
MSPALDSVTQMLSATTASEDFRSVVLRGRNVASFKFALAKSILALAESGATSASLEELGAHRAGASAQAGRRAGEGHRVPEKASAYFAASQPK